MPNKEYTLPNIQNKLLTETSSSSGWDSLSCNLACSKAWLKDSTKRTWEKKGKSFSFLKFPPLLLCQGWKKGKKVWWNRILLVQKELSNRGGIWAPILCNRCLGATARSWPLAYQVSAGPPRSLATRPREQPLRPPTRRILGRCNQHCIHQPQSNHQSDLQHSNIKKPMTQCLKKTKSHTLKSFL